MNNKQKFIHYVMLTFTYSMGVGNSGSNSVCAYNNNK